MNTSYANIPTLYASPDSDIDYVDSYACDCFIKVLYRLYGIMEHLFIMYPPVNDANRHSITHKLVDAVKAAVYDMPYCPPLDAKCLTLLADFSDQPDKAGMWQMIEDYFYPVKRMVMNNYERSN